MEWESTVYPVYEVDRGKCPLNRGDLVHNVWEEGELGVGHRKIPYLDPQVKRPGDSGFKPM